MRNVSFSKVVVGGVSPPVWENIQYGDADVNSSVKYRGGGSGVDVEVGDKTNVSVAVTGMGEERGVCVAVDSVTEGRVPKLQEVISRKHPRRNFFIPLFITQST